MSPHAFVDESARGGRYILCAALVEARDLDDVRKLARSLCLPGQARWHFKSESDRRRRQIIDQIVRCDAVRARLYFGKGPDLSVRRDGLTAIVSDLLDLKTGRLVIESRESLDAFDRHYIAEALRKASTELAYTHLRPRQEPCLWLPDAVAWAYGAGGHWRRRLQPMIDKALDVGDVT
ncbi:MAG TPA: hypothetical protein VE465_21985 [Streptosporangiaceae bacterium]|nr:hypothetical protein [Streptosporangiaceae bacterium]